MKPLGLGIIGLHHQHPRWYFPLWKHLPEYRPVAIAEEDRAFLDDQKDFYNLDIHTDYRDLLERSDIDVVIVFLPHSMMPEAVRRAAEAGKHVIVEKPGAATLGGMVSIVSTAKAFPRLKISSPYCWRNHKASERIKSIIDKGLIGDITAMEARLNAGGPHRYIRDNCPWVLKAAEGGGPMWNLGVHWIDYMRWATGLSITGVSGAVSGPYGPPDRDIEDNAQAVLTFDNGAVGMLDISYSLPDAYPGKRDIYISFRGTLGTVSWAPAWEGTRDEILLVSKHSAPDSGDVQRIEIITEDIPGYGGHMGASWLRNFARAVNENTNPQVSIEDMYEAVKTADAFYRSLTTKRFEQ